MEFAELIHDFGLFNNVDLFVLGLRRRVLLSIDLAIVGRDSPSIFFMATAYDSPRWVKSDSDPYKRLLSRMANALMMAERQQSSSAQRRELFRLPTVDQRNTEPV